MFSQVDQEREDVSVDARARKRCLVVGGRGGRGWDRHGGQRGAVLQRSRGIGGLHRPTLVPADVTDAHAHLASTPEPVPARAQG